MPSQSVPIHLDNNSNQALRLAVFQENTRNQDPPCASYFWEVRTLDSRARLSLEWPLLDLQVAGLIGVAGSGETTSTSNIEDAKEGQHWVLTQRPGEALNLAPAPEQGRQGAQVGVTIENHVTFAKRTALLLKQKQLLLGYVLDSDDSVNLWPRPALCFALVPQSVKRGDRVDHSLFSQGQPWVLSLEGASTAASYSAILSKDASSGALSLTSSAEPRIEKARNEAAPLTPASGPQG